MNFERMEAEAKENQEAYRAEQKVRERKESRERIATAVLAGMWANKELRDEEFSFTELSHDAIGQADALLEALDQ